MEDAIKLMLDAIAELQGQALAQSTVMEAVLMSHPDPAKLREAWHRISAPRIADNVMSLAGKGRAADEATQYHLLKWQEKVDLAARPPAA